MGSSRKISVVIEGHATYKKACSRIFLEKKKHTEFPQFEILCNSIIKDKLFKIDNGYLLSSTTKFKWSYNYEF